MNGERTYDKGMGYLAGAWDERKGKGMEQNHWTRAWDKSMG